MPDNLSKVVVLVGVILAALFLIIALPDSSEPRIDKFFIASLIAAIVWIIAIPFILKLTSKHNALVPTALFFAIAFRLTFLLFFPDTSYTSDDAYRYVWEGKLIVNGYNPFRYSPEDLEVAEFIDQEIHPNINHPSFKTIYPPLAQGFFVVAYLISPQSIFGIKVLSLFFEFIAMLLMIILLKKLNLPSARIFIMAFAPLAVLEFYYSAHLDIWGLPFLIGFLIFFQNKKYSLGGLLFGLAVLIKLFPLFFAPVIFFKLKGKERLKFTISAVAIVLVGYLFFITAGWDLFESLFKYLSGWQFNNSLFYIVSKLTTDATGVIMAIIFLCWIVVVSYRSGDLYLKLLMIFTGYICLTHTLFPWYLIWLLPLLMIRPIPSLYYLMGAIYLSYHVFIGFYNNGGTGWEHQEIYYIIEYLPFYFLLFFDIRNYWRESHSSLTTKQVSYHEK